jgi:hypothetical protein
VTIGTNNQNQNGKVIEACRFMAKAALSICSVMSAAGEGEIGDFLDLK